MAQGVVSRTREMLAVDLRTYGEDALASRVPGLTDAEMTRIGELAFAKSTGPSAVSLLAHALVLAAIEVMEEAPRPPRWSRRKLKGIYPGV